VGYACVYASFFVFNVGLMWDKVGYKWDNGGQSGIC